MGIGSDDYFYQLARMSLNSNGAYQLQYLESLPFEKVCRINDVMKKYIEELENGK